VNVRAQNDGPAHRFSANFPPLMRCPPGHGRYGNFQATLSEDGTTPELDLYMVGIDGPTSFAHIHFWPARR